MTWPSLIGLKAPTVFSMEGMMRLLIPDSRTWPLYNQWWPFKSFQEVYKAVLIDPPAILADLVVTATPGLPKMIGGAPAALGTSTVLLLPPGSRGSTANDDVMRILARLGGYVTDGMSVHSARKLDVDAFGKLYLDLAAVARPGAGVALRG